MEDKDLVELQNREIETLRQQRDDLLEIVEQQRLEIKELRRQNDGSVQRPVPKEAGKSRTPNVTALRRRRQAP